MNLYLISQDVNNGYDTFDSAVVAAENDEAARNTYPHWSDSPPDPPPWDKRFSDWADSPDQVTAKLIGVAVEGTKAGCICASFNAS